MTFVDTLRASRESRVAVLHEFWTQYNPSQKRVHAFFEGHDDVSFFTPFIQRYIGASRLYPYRCEGKARVYELFAAITQRVPGAGSVLFFVDKDLDDILGSPWPTDPRVFVTDVYSVENYFVNRDVFTKLYRDGIRLNGVTFDESVLLTHFDKELDRFHRKMMPLMAWVVVVRRAGGRPNLGNIDLAAFLDMTDECEVRVKSRSRLQLLAETTGVKHYPGVFRQLSPARRELARILPQRVVRGKFDAWFFVEFWKSMVKQLRSMAREAGGNVAVQVVLEQRTFCAALKAYVDIPRSLDLFLSAHFGEHGNSNRTSQAREPRAGRLAALALALARLMQRIASRESPWGDSS